MRKTFPLKDGVPASKVWAPAGEWETFLDFLCERFKDVEKTDWISRMEQQKVLKESGESIFSDSKFEADTRIYYYRVVDDETPLPFFEKILYQDEHLLVADKPHFMQIIPRGRYLHHTLMVRLQNQLDLPELSPLHRLDRETAGIVLFSKNPKTRSLYQDLFAKRTMQKVYHALAPSSDTISFPRTVISRIERGEPFIKMKEVDGEANSETHIELFKDMGKNSLYRLKPITGKTHQLRVHMASLGLPIKNDPLYPELLNKNQLDYSNPLKLLAKSISFKCPIEHQIVKFNSEQDLI
ncbi:MAG: pseudouridine synthase [Methylococcales bacterium]